MSPVAEKLKGKGFDVLYATEPLDEIMFESLTSFGDYDIKDAGKDTLKLDDDDEEAAKKKEELSTLQTQAHGGLCMSARLMLSWPARGTG